MQDVKYNPRSPFKKKKKAAILGLIENVGDLKVGPEKKKKKCSQSPLTTFPFLPQKHGAHLELTAQSTST